jgi:hypothetical protein
MSRKKRYQQEAGFFYFQQNIHYSTHSTRLLTLKMKIRSGKYKHFKGKFYEVIGVARDSENLEEIVVYKALYNSAEFGNEALWLRPIKQFFDQVLLNGKNVPRFEFLEKTKKDSDHDPSQIK